jgi:hypothetical protein
MAPAGRADLVQLDPESVQAVAQAVLAMMRAEGATAGEASPVEAPSLLSAAEVARQFDVSRDWFYAHAAELGVVKLGSGSKPRLRFDAAVVERVLSGDVLRGRAPMVGGSARTRAQAIVNDGSTLDGLDALPAAWRNAVSDGRAA